MPWKSATVPAAVILA